MPLPPPDAAGTKGRNYTILVSHEGLILFLVLYNSYLKKNLNASRPPSELFFLLLLLLSSH